MFEQKLYKNGSSVVITVPKQLMRKYNLRDGSDVVVDDERGKITVSANKKKRTTTSASMSQSSRTPEFKKWLDDVSRDEEKLIRELAKR